MSAWEGNVDDGNVTPFPLRPRRLRKRAPADIPPRSWLYGTILQRRYCTILFAPGGVGKSQLALGAAIDLASDRHLFGLHVFERVRVWYLSLEDDEDEIDRRIAAYCLVHDLAWDDLEDWLFTHDGRVRPVCIARKGEDGSTIAFPDIDELVTHASLNGIGVLVVDPFIRSHQLAENSNVEMDAAMAAWAMVAQEVGCAVLLVHHSRKGPADNRDGARGASALVDACRTALLLSTMSAEEAAEVGIPSAAAGHFVRLDGAKSNMAPASEAMWFEMVERELGNGTETYPHGDRVSALRRWSKPGVMNIPAPELRAFFDGVRAGPSVGEQYTLAKTGPNNVRWVGHLLLRICDGMPERRATLILKLWVENGVLSPGEYTSPGQRKPRAGIALNESKVVSIINLGGDAPFNEC